MPETRKLPLSELAKTLLVLGAPAACMLLAACGDEHEARVGADAQAAAATADAAGTDASQAPTNADDASVGNRTDGSAPSQDAAALDASVTQDAAPDAATPDAAAPDATTPASDGASPDAAEAGACTPGSSGCPKDPLAPFKLDCANLPSDGTCAGGPREVLLVTEETGVITMFDPVDGHFLGYFKRRSAKYNVQWIEEYRFADQGPDQCIWTVSEDRRALIERWNTDGSYRDVPLQPHYFDLPAAAPMPLVETTSIAFSRDKVYVTSQDTTQGYPALTRWNLDGTFDRIELDGSYAIKSLLVLGDGSIVYTEGSRVARNPAGGGQQRPVLGELSSPGQIAYAGDGDLLVVEESTGESLHKVDVESGMSRAIYPKDTTQSAKYGIAPLRNGKWLVAGGALEVSVLDPASLNPPGQHVLAFADRAIESSEFKHIGRACLPEAFVASRASKPANNTCVAPPDGPAILSANFEGTDDFQGTDTQRHYKEFYDRGTTGVTSSIAPSEGFEGSRALKVSGSGSLSSSALGRPNSGVYVRLPANSRPKYVSYRVKVTDAPDRELGAFVLRNEAGTTSEYSRLLSNDVYHGFLRSLESDVATATTLFNVWIKVEFRNIDWAKRTSDLYVNCQRLAENVAIPVGYGDSVDLLDLYNFPTAPPNEKTVAWYDDIVIK